MEEYKFEPEMVRVIKLIRKGKIKSDNAKNKVCDQVVKTKP